MKIIAIGDPHLGNLEKMVNKFHYPPNYFEQIAKNIATEIPSADLLLIAGDLVWNRDFSEATQELQPLQNLQVRNICFVEGNHDHWVTQYSTMYELYNTSSFYFLSGRNFFIENVGICGIRGTEKNSSLTMSEFRHLENCLKRLTNSDINLAICVIHFPPTSLIFKNPEDSFAEDQYFALMEEYGINKIVYGHLHAGTYKINLYMKIDNIELYCTSIDFFNWKPVKIL
ncbi:MAG: metallophosphoesterase [Promethearchaeota archaeon]